MKRQLIYSILLMCVLFSSCGSTKVSVQKPAAGTQTTITVTTNNPITTDVKPETSINICK